MRPVQKEITAQNADEGIFELQPCTRDGLIFNISEAGKTLTGGTLELAPEAYITLNSSCSDIMLEDLVVKGISIFAHGAETTVGVYDGSIRGGVQGITVEAGAWLTASNLEVTESAVAGVEVKDEGSIVKLATCTLKDFLPLYNDTFSVRGVHAHSGSKAELGDVKVSGGVFAVDVRSSAEAQLVNCIIKDAIQSCVVVRDGAHGKLEGCVLERTKMNLPKTFGLYVDGTGSVVRANRTKLLEHAQSGAFVRSSGALVAYACMSAGNHVAGFVVHTNSLMELTDCTSERDGKGCLVEEGGSLTAVNVAVARCEDEAFAIGEEGEAELIDCSGTNCGEEGVQLAHKGTLVKMETCTFSENEYDNVVVRQGAKAILKGCTLSKSVSRSEIAADGEGTEVDLEGSTMHGNAKCGVLALQGSRAIVKSCISQGNKQVGYQAAGGAKMTVIESTSDGDLVGCGVGEGGEIQMQAVVVDGVAKGGKLPA